MIRGRKEIDEIEICKSLLVEKFIEVSLEVAKIIFKGIDVFQMIDSSVSISKKKII